MVRSSAIKREGTKDARPRERENTPERDCIRNRGKQHKERKYRGW